MSLKIAPSISHKSEVKNQIEEKKEIYFFREKRLEVPSNISSYIDIDMGFNEIIRCDLKNISEFGCRCILKKENDFIGLNINLKNIKITINSQLVFDGSAKVVYEAKNEYNLSLGLTFTSGSADVEKINSIITVEENSENIYKIKNLFNLSSTIRSDFKNLVADFNFLLQKLKNTFDLEEKRIHEMSISERSKKNLQEQTINLAISLYANLIHEGVTSFKTIVDTLDSSEQEKHKEYFRTTFHPLLIGAPFIKRAYEKPLGYAGDYGLMLMFYEYEDIGDTLFEKFMHRYACHEPSAVANKNRVYFLSDLIINLYEQEVKNNLKKFKFSSIACGPAKETRLFIEHISQEKKSNKLDCPIEVVLIDHESEALSYAYSSLKKMNGYGTDITAKMIKEDAVLGTIKEKAFTEQLCNSNVIVSAGLFDYLSDRVSSKLISSLFAKLAPGGVLIIGNVSTLSPDKFSMDYLMDWKLFYRNDVDLKNLVEDEIKNQSEINVISEPLNINLFLQIKKRV